MERFPQKKLAILGAGPTALFLVNHILSNHQEVSKKFSSITIFEKEAEFGTGMPYNPKTTDIHNRANICCEEIPTLPKSLTNWLRGQNDDLLKAWNVDRATIATSSLYSRIVLGFYFQEQFQVVLAQLRNSGFEIIEMKNVEITDVIKNAKSDTFTVVEKNGNMHLFSKIVIAVGHKFQQNDNAEKLFFSSPWPINKLLPPKDEFYNFRIGLLGASLSAFDVVTSLAHRHGTFIKKNQQLEFVLNPKALNFKISMHTAEGWLPHLQYEQAEPLRGVYRLTTRKELIALIGRDGFLSIKSFFDHIGRKAVVKALRKDEKMGIAKIVNQAAFTFEDFIDKMESEYHYVNSFLGMETEMKEAVNNIRKNKPIFWMETLDDLMYCLNYHADLLSAEDYLYLRLKIMPFLMNVIAALPIQSAEILLALYKANCIELVTGKVEIKASSKKNIITVTAHDGSVRSETYNMFINCGGQQTVEIDSYPFKSLVESKTVSPAYAKFKATDSAAKLEHSEWKEKLFRKNEACYMKLGGIGIDSAFRVVQKEGTVEPNIQDVSCAHIAGARPYSYGLQACDANAAILVASWLKLEDKKINKKIEIEKITEIYDDLV
jgi:uncharacterized NAD(P)/FAD-binding protein YdhS